MTASDGTVVDVWVEYDDILEVPRVLDYRFEFEDETRALLQADGYDCPTFVQNEHEYTFRVNRYL